MKKLRTFICTECTKIEQRFVDDDTTELPCYGCLSPSKLQISTPKYFGNSTGRIPSAVN